MGLLLIRPLSFLHCAGNSQKGTTSQKNTFNTLPTFLHNTFSFTKPRIIPNVLSNHPARSDTDYDAASTISKSQLLTGKKSDLQMSAVDDAQGHERVSSKMDLDYDYSRLKLGKNLFSFFHSSQILTQARVASSNLDEFEMQLDMGEVLLREGEQGLDGSLEVSVASRMLEEAAVRFAAASAIVPSSTAAVTAWGFTLLTHGKLKLLFSRSLRDMLLEKASPRKRTNAEYTVDAFRSMIPKICEESEKLLVEAGRKLGKAALLERDNDFALYNWGLSLFYRAQLFAADGLEEVVEDADKVYLIAIEKFKETSQLGQEYSSAAYLSWALALRDRYWLQGSANKRDVKLLEQAKWASQQALHAHPNVLQAKMIVQICTEELAQCQMQ